MAWEHLSLTKPHLVYIILGGFTSLFMLCSSVIKERMYIGEAAVATLCGVIFGPHAAGLIDPISWGNTDIVTIEFSRIVLVIQCFAIGVELPKYYMEKHWKSVTILLVPVMTFGWLIVSLIVWWMVPTLNWLDSLVVSACLTPTDPVLASSVVGKGKFAKRVPRHLRDLLSAESGCNDGMAFPFVYLALYLISGHLEAKTVTFHWICYTILYECIFGAFLGFIIGYLARHAIKYSEEHDLIDRESFLVFYFVLSLFCAGVGSILGVDDLLLGFAAGVGFSNDGWFSEKTEESHVSNVIDLILNLSYFVFLGTIIPWQDYNNLDIGLSAWRLCVLAILVILFRRLPIMLALKPVIPDIKTWREALFAGHFGPMGVGAVFIALLARGELQTGHAIPSSELPDENHPKYDLIRLIWPIVSFIVIASIIVHGSSIAVFTLGKRINTLSLTMSYTKGDEEGPTWMNRLPRLTSQSRSQMKSTASSTDAGDMPQFPPGTLPPIGVPNHFLRRHKEEEAGASSREGSRAPSVVSRKRRKKWDEGVGPGGPVQQSAIFPERRPHLAPTASEPSSVTEKDAAAETPQGGSGSATPSRASEPEDGCRLTFTASADSGRNSPAVSVYEQGSKLIFETPDGEVLAVRSSQPSPDHAYASGGVEAAAAGVAAEHAHLGMEEAAQKLAQKLGPSDPATMPGKVGWSMEYLRNKMGEAYRQKREKRKGKPKEQRVHEPALAYQYGNTVIVEDKDGEVIKTYDLPTDKADAPGPNPMMRYMGLSSKGAQRRDPGPSAVQASGAIPPPSDAGPSTAAATALAGAGAGGDQDDNDDRRIRFTIRGEGKRMNEVDFVRAMRKLDARTRREVVEGSSASLAVKRLASMEVSPRVLAETDPAAAAIAVAAVREPAAPTPGDSSAAASALLGGDGGGDNGSGSGSGGKEEVPSRSGGAVEAAAGDGAGLGDEETPAERRRREAALGMTAVEDDSDEEAGPRVVPQRRGIRFADIVERRTER